MLTLITAAKEHHSISIFLMCNKWGNALNMISCSIDELALSTAAYPHFWFTSGNTGVTESGLL